RAAGGIEDGREHPRRAEACDVVRQRRIRAGRGDANFARTDQRRVEIEHLRRLRKPLAQLGGPRRHPIFSTFTRNALNSGVRAFASPTKGVSAFASQYRAFSGCVSATPPTNPQWIGIPM